MVYNPGHVLRNQTSSLSFPFKEFDEYYAYQYDIHSDFDILKWWKQLSGPSNFPILARMAGIFLLSLLQRVIDEKRSAFAKRFR